MRWFITAIILACNLFSPLLAQNPIQITASDLPAAGDTDRRSIAANPQIVDINQKGANQRWSYQNLNPATQYVDTFRSLSSLPQVYGLLAFQKSIDYGKREAAVLDNLPMADQLPFSDLLGLYNKSGNTFEQVALGVNLAVQSIPVPFQQNDRIYQLPLTYQQNDSSNAFVSFPPQNLPFPVPDSTLYFEEARKRINTVDAWGTLKTPYGSFEVLRVKTVIKREDSVSLQGVNQAVTPPDQVVFKWLAKSSGTPVLQVRAQRLGGQLVVSNASYQDSNRNLGPLPPTGTAPVTREASPSLKLYPNPVKYALNLQYAGSYPATYRVYNQQGQLVTEGVLRADDRKTNSKLDVGAYPKGLYTLSLTSSRSGATTVRQFVKR